MTRAVGAGTIPRAMTVSYAELAKKVKAGQTITLLCSSACEREDRCHRSLLKALIERQINNAEGPPPT